MARGLLWVALAAMSWGTTGTVLKVIGATSPDDALLVGAIRMAVAAPLLALAAWLRHEWPRFAPGPWLIAGVCMAAYQVCYFSAVRITGVAATALLAICSAPIFVAALGYVVLGEELTRRRVLALPVRGCRLLLGTCPARAWCPARPGAARPGC